MLKTSSSSADALAHSPRSLASAWRKRRSDLTEIDEVCLLFHPHAEAHAIRLHEGMQATLGQACSLDAPVTLDEHGQLIWDASRVGACLERIAHCKYVLLLQTAEVLSLPWVLLATYRAYASKRPIVCVLVEGGGYDFGAAKGQLERLRSTLDAAAREQLHQVLASFHPPTSVGQRFQI